MPSVWEPRHAELVKALCGLRESTALELLPDVMPVLNVLQDGPEYAFQRGERYHASYGWCAAGGAGTYSGLRLRNPAGSNALVTVHQIRALMGGAQNVLGYKVFDSTDLGVPTILGRPALDARDGRDLGAVGGAGCSTVAIPSNGAAATVYTAGNTWAYVYGASNTNVELLPADMSIVLLPGWACGFIGATAITAIGGTFYWEERAVLADELRVK